MKWEWFVGGEDMYWLSIILFVILIFGFTITYIIDPTAFMSEYVTDIDSSSIKNLSDEYLNQLGITIDHSIEYRFVNYEYNKNHSDLLYGTFHEWNNTYYIDIYAKLADDKLNLLSTVRHEVRHMVVEYLKDEKIIDLTKYTEEIAQERNNHFNSLFNSGVYLLKGIQSGDGYTL